MTAFLEQLSVGLTNGLLFGLIALGYSMVYGILQMVNFAHGDLFMVAAFLALAFLDVLQVETLTPALQVLATVGVTGGVMLISGSLNLTIDRFVFRPLRNRSPLAPLVSAIGVSFILQNVGLFLGGLPLKALGYGRSAAAPKAFFDLIGNGRVENLPWGLSLSFKDLLCAAVSLVCMFILWGIVRLTKLGRAMRAIAQDPIAAQLMGVPIERVTGQTFFLGGALAGVAAVIYGLCVGTVHYQMGYQNGLYAFSAATIGGIGSIVGAILGGLMIGVVRAMSDQYIGLQWQPAILFGLLIVLLILRPQGLLGYSRREKV